MFKFKVGNIKNPQTDEWVDIKVGYKNVLLSIMLGIGISAIGITISSLMAFRKGAYAHDEAEFNALDALGLICGSTTNPIINEHNIK